MHRGHGCGIRAERNLRGMPMLRLFAMMLAVLALVLAFPVIATGLLR